MVNNILSIINLILVVTALVIAIIALTNHTKDGYQENLTDGPYCDYNYAIPPYTCCKGTDGKMDPKQHCSIINDYNSIVCREGAHKATPENCIPGYYCDLDTNQCEIPVDSDGNHDYKLCKHQQGTVGSNCYITKEACEARATNCKPLIKSRDRVIMAFALPTDSVPLSHAQNSTGEIWHPLINAHTDMGHPINGPYAVVTKQGYTYSDLVNNFKNNYVVITQPTDPGGGKPFAQTDFFRIWAPQTDPAGYTNNLTLGSYQSAPWNDPFAAWENPHADKPVDDLETEYKFELFIKPGNLRYGTAYGKLGSNYYNNYKDEAVYLVQLVDTWTDSCTETLDPGQSGCGYLGVLANYSAVMFAPAN